jgi:hypothetical protein
VLLFCPSGFSVVVVLELLWANPAPPSARLSPMAIATVLDRTSPPISSKSLKKANSSS